MKTKRNVHTSRERDDTNTNTNKNKQKKFRFNSIVLLFVHVLSSVQKLREQRRKRKEARVYILKGQGAETRKLGLIGDARRDWKWGF